MCDFLVSAMLTMLAGMASQGNSGVTPGKGAILDRGSTALILEELHRRSAELESMREKLREAQAREGFSREREAELKALAEQLAETLAKAELIEQKLELHPENAGALSPEQLQKALEQEIRKRALATVQRREAESELARMRNSLKSISGDLAVLNTNFAVSQQQLTDTRKSLEEREAELKQTGSALMKAREELAARQNELAGVRATLQSEQANLSRTREEAQSLESDLSFAKGQLSAAEHDLAVVRSQSERNRKLAEQREAEMREAQRQLSDAKNMLKNAVTELSRTKAELNKSREETARTAAKKAEAERMIAEKQGQADTARAQLEATQRELRAAEEKLRSDVLERYDAAVVRLTLALRERRLLLSQEGGGVYFLPLVQIAGKTVMPGFHKQLFGDEKYALNFVRIDQLEYRVNISTAPQEQPGTLLRGPLLLLPGEPRIAAIEFTVRGRKPLAALTIDALKQRGLEDLFLFKARSFGKESASLNGRCSLDLSKGGSQLYIRNSGRSPAGELKAEPGDFIITKQGDFVGIVTAIEDFDMGRRQEAKCFVFPEHFKWDGAKTIRLDKAPDAEYFENFSKGVRETRAGYEQ